jgi:dTDP-4-dehydrorhamnose reductase
MKILVLGSNGMAGHVITKYMSIQNYDVDTVARANATFNLNVENKEQIEQFFNNTKNDYDFIINCVGLLVQDSINRPDRAAIINGWFPHLIEQTIKESKTKLIHLSTDCVFNGSLGQYVESSEHTETNFYGKSKSFGEVHNNKDITFRMSIIGPEKKENGTGLFHWFVNKSPKEVNGWDNAWWNGITTLQLAKCIDMYIQNPTITGIYHLVNNSVSTNKYELLCKINLIFGLNKVVNKTQGPKTINKILIDTRQEINFNIPDYDAQLIELKDFCS